MNGIASFNENVQKNPPMINATIVPMDGPVRRRNNRRKNWREKNFTRTLKWEKSRSFWGRCPCWPKTKDCWPKTSLRAKPNEIYLKSYRLVLTWAAPARIRNIITKAEWNFEKTGIKIVANDDTKIRIARNRFGPRILTATDDTTCVIA